MAKKTGRNDPCPCGSGKKYKKCCMKKDEEKSKEEKKFCIETYDRESEESYVSGGIEDLYNAMFAGSEYEAPEFSLKPLDVEEIPDYGTPELDEDLFEPLRTKWNTGIREFYSDATRGIDYLERRDDYVIIKGSLDEEFTEKFGDCNDLNGFFSYIDDNCEKISESLMIRMSMKYGCSAGPYLLERMNGSYDSEIMVCYADMIHFSPCDFREGILELINKPVREPFTLSILSLMLFRYNNPDDYQVLWNCYNLFKEHYPDTLLFEGPLIAIQHIWAIENNKEFVMAYTPELPEL